MTNPLTIIDNYYLDMIHGQLGFFDKSPIFNNYKNLKFDPMIINNKAIVTPELLSSLNLKNDLTLAISYYIHSYIAYGKLCLKQADQYMYSNITPDVLNLAKSWCSLFMKCGQISNVACPFNEYGQLINLNTESLKHVLMFLGSFQKG